MEFKALDIVLPESAGCPINGKVPVLDCYIFKNVEANPTVKRPAVIVVPGGGYMIEPSDREGGPVAMQYLAQGYHVFVARYNITPHHFPTQLFQLTTCVKMIRDHAEEWFVDPNKIYINGFSAGGHLTATLGAYWDHELITKRLGYKAEEVKPNGLILCYPAITTDQVISKIQLPMEAIKATGMDYDTWVTPLCGDDPKLAEMVSIEKVARETFPPTFIYHTAVDIIAHVQNSMLLAQSLIKLGVRTEMHIFPTGFHGLSLGRPDISPPDGIHVTEHATQWLPLAQRWIKDLDEIVAHDR